MDREGTGERSGRVKFMAGLARFASYFCIYGVGWLIGSKGPEAGLGPLVWLFGGVVLASVARSLVEIVEYDRRHHDEERRQTH